MKELAIACNYGLINYSILDKECFKVPKNLIAATYKKDENLSTNNKFISKEKFNQINGIIDTKFLKHTRNYANKREYDDIISLIKKLPAPIRYIGGKSVSMLARFLK